MVEKKRDQKVINSARNITVPELIIKKKHLTWYISIGLVSVFIISTIVFHFLCLSISDLFLFWAIGTPYSILLINHYRNLDSESKRLSPFIQEVKELLYSINFLRDLHEPKQAFINDIIAEIESTI